jgi:hypothetical protein
MDAPVPHVADVVELGGELATFPVVLLELSFEAFA